MSNSVSVRSRVCLVSLLTGLSLAVITPPHPAFAASAMRQAKPAPAAPAPAPPAPPLFNLDLKATPLRQALQSLFNNAQTQYSLSPDVPDVPVTLAIRNQTLNSALRLLLQQAGGGQRLGYIVEAGVYIINATPMSSGPDRLNQIHLSNVNPSALLDRLQTAFPNSMIFADAPSSSLLVRAPDDQVQQIREMVSLLDRAPHTVVLKAEVVMVADTGSAASATKAAISTKTASKAKDPVSTNRSTLLSTVLRTATGQEAMGDDKLTGSPAQSAHLQLNATPTLLGDGTYQLDTRWDVSLPLPTKTTGTATSMTAALPGLIRLEKRLTTSSHLRSGETVIVGGVVLNQYGLQGEILLFVTLTDATP